MIESPTLFVHIISPALFCSLTFYPSLTQLAQIINRYGEKLLLSLTTLYPLRPILVLYSIPYRVMAATAAIGPILGAPGTLNACIQLCQTVQFARNYEDDFALSKARLLMVGLRLKEWGQALELIPNDDTGRSQISSSALNESQKQNVQDIFDMILQAFENAKTKSNSYACRNKLSNAETLGEDQEAVEKKGVCFAIRARLSGRDKPLKAVTADLMDKTRWIIYRKDHFNTLLTNICAATKELVESFPVQRDLQQKICQHDVSKLDESQIQLLSQPDFVGEDTELQKAISVIMNEKGLHFHDNKVRHRAKINMGNKYGKKAMVPSGITVNGNAFSGKSVSQFGHSIGISRSYKSSSSQSETDEQTELDSSDSGAVSLLFLQKHPHSWKGPMS